MLIINNNNAARIAAELETAQGRARERTISVEDIFDYPQKILDELKVPKKALEGSTFWVDPCAQNFPNSYKFRPESTQFKLDFTGGKWRVYDICRTMTPKNGSGKQVRAFLSESAKLALLDRFHLISI